MARKLLSGTFIQQIKEQLLSLREADLGYAALQLYVAGVTEPWEFLADDEFEFHENTGVLIVRDGPSDPNEPNDSGWYVQYLHRPIDSGGALFWLQQMRNGVPQESILDGILASDEYFNRP